MRAPLCGCLLVASGIATSPVSAAGKGELIFEDRFERSESQEEKDEPGNEWTTSSEKTAKGHKQVDLKDGVLAVDTHPEANHATSVRHAFEFRDGTVELRFRLPADDDTLTLNFADMSLKSVHAGHLFKVTIGTRKVTVTDQKTGIMDLEIREARKEDALSKAQQRLLSETVRTFPVKISAGEWHEVEVTVDGDELICVIDGEQVGAVRSPGFGHETKRLLRLLVAKRAEVDDVKIWKLR